MKPSFAIAACVPLALTFAALAQSPDEPQSAAKPVAYVYVSRPTHVDGFAAAANGKLTPVPGSPFAGIALSHMSVNKKFLFGSGDNGQDLYTFSIASNGALKPVSVTNAEKYNTDSCGGFGPTAVDATGTTLYNTVNQDCDIAIQSFRIEANGELQYLGVTDTDLPTDVIFLSNLGILGNNKFAVMAGCAEDTGEVPILLELKRESNGMLVVSNSLRTVPDPKDPNAVYCPYSSIATDPSDHFALVLSPYDDEAANPGPDGIATYSVASNGNVTTKSTYENMPAHKVQYVATMSISPTGKLLALGGSKGFQVFHYNGSSPVSKFSGDLQSGSSFMQFGWDGDSHLYALSSNGKLFVYTITSTSITEAPGSPYSIPQASSVIVRSIQ